MLGPQLSLLSIVVKSLPRHGSRLRFKSQLCHLLTVGPLRGYIGSSPPFPSSGHCVCKETVPQTVQRSFFPCCHKTGIGVPHWSPSCCVALGQLQPFSGLILGQRA